METFERKNVSCVFMVYLRHEFRDIPARINRPMRII